MPPKKRQRGSVRTRGGSHNFLVYAGVDPVTGKEVYLSESTKDEKKIEEIRTRLLAKVDQQRNASTRATLAYVIENWLDLREVEETT
jgi:hypothetical protein